MISDSFLAQLYIEKTWINVIWIECTFYVISKSVNVSFHCDKNGANVRQVPASI